MATQTAERKTAEKKVKDAFRKQGSPVGISDEKMMVLAHYFAGPFHWYAAAFDPKGKRFFCLAECAGLSEGWFTLKSMRFRTKMLKPRPRIKLDPDWKPRSRVAVRREIIRRLKSRRGV